QRGPLHLLQKVLPVLLVLVGRDEHHLQLVPVLGGLLEFAVKLPEARVELAARRVLAAAEVEAEQGHSAAQRLHVHLGLLAAADQPLSQQTHQELRHRCSLLAFAFLIIQRLMLLFNEAMPPSFLNRATRVGPPSPIVIEKLVPRSEEPGSPSSSRSSVRFSALSEERLMAAVRLAKRDLRRRRQEALRSATTAAAAGPPLEVSNHDTSSSVDLDWAQEDAASIPLGAKTSSSREKATRPRARSLVHSPQRRSVAAGLGDGRSPPTRDPGPGPSGKNHQLQLSREIQKVQKELLVYIEKVSKTSNENMEKSYVPQKDRAPEGVFNR
ncbi:hypothetical protein CRUP_004240, partial [Coryphaenoides rupestris]